MYQKVKLPSKKHHLYRIPLRLLASVYKLYHMTTSAVPFVYGAGVFKDLVHGVSWLVFEYFKQHTTQNLGNGRRYNFISHLTL